jgi:hypothetical protein
MSDDPWELMRSIRHRRDVLPHIALLNLAEKCVGLAETTEKIDKMYWCVAAITFAALTIEGYINFIGWSKIPHWDEIEQTSSPSAKLAIIEIALNLKFDRSRLPFSKYREIFRFRNWIVHAKVDQILVKYEEDHSHPFTVLSGKPALSEWEKTANLDEAKQIVDATNNMLEEIGKQIELKITPEGHSIHRVWIEKKPE